MPPLLGVDLFVEAMERRMERRLAEAGELWSEIARGAGRRDEVLARYGRVMRRAFALREAIAARLLVRWEVGRKESLAGQEVAA